MKTHHFFVVVALGCAAFLWAQNPSPSPASNTGVTEPLIHKNLQVFLISDEDRLTGLKVKTLDEAMKEKFTTVRETGNVNQLSIQNGGKEDYVYVQSGDIVKGGQQDRTLASDLLLSPNSGTLPLDAFCVEHGRWTGREGESATAFSGSSKILNTRELKYAAKVKKSQGEVWSKVGEAQQKLSENVFKSGNGSLAVGNSAAVPTINDARSATSLQLSLENGKLQDMAAEYTKIFQDAPDKDQHSVGFVYAVNGKFSAAEIYANHALFHKLWGKLLEAAVNEAIAEQKDGVDGAPLAVADAQRWLGDVDAAPMTVELHSASNVSLRKETAKAVRFDTLVPTTRGGHELMENDWIHRSVLSKEGMVATKGPAAPRLIHSPNHGVSNPALNVHIQGLDPNGNQQEAAQQIQQLDTTIFDCAGPQDRKPRK